MAVARPLEGLVRSVASPQETTADLGFRSNTRPSSATHFVELTPFCQREQHDITTQPSYPPETSEYSWRR
jgi:hypothetical protein